MLFGLAKLLAIGLWPAGAGSCLLASSLRNYEEMSLSLEEAGKGCYNVTELLQFRMGKGYNK